MNNTPEVNRSGLPLEGLRVLDMSHVIAGPLASFYLSQMGAEVIKIEAPIGGDVMRAAKSARKDEVPDGFISLNAGKRSLAIDIRKPEGADLVRSLASSATDSVNQIFAQFEMTLSIARSRATVRKALGPPVGPTITSFKHSPA